MHVGRVNAAGADQPDEVHAMFRFHRALDCRLEDAILEERAVLDRQIDADEILRDDATRPEIEVSDLAVPDLTWRKPNRQTRRLEQRHRESRERLPRGGLGQRDGVALAFGSMSPAIEDDEHNRALLGHGERGTGSREREAGKTGKEDNDGLASRCFPVPCSLFPSSRLICYVARG